MATFTSAERLAYYQKSQAIAKKGIMASDNYRNAERMREKLEKRGKQLMSGSISTEQLRVLGHPYKRDRRLYTTSQRSARAFQGRVNLLPINVQHENGLRSRFQVYLVRLTDAVQIRFRDNSPHAQFQIDPANEGTRNMRPRGFMIALLDSYRKYLAIQNRNRP
jgi:hypothetical protein